MSMYFRFFAVLLRKHLTLPRKVLEWTMRKKGIPEVLVRSVMSLYERAKTKGRVDSELSEEFEVKVGPHHGSVLLPFVFTFLQLWQLLSCNCYESPF